MCLEVRKLPSLYIFLVFHFPFSAWLFLKRFPFFCIQPYQIQIIFKHLIQRWDPNRYYHFGSEWTRDKIAMKGYLIHHKSPELEPHYQMQFGIIPRISFFVVGRFYTSAVGYSQYFLSSTNQVINKALNSWDLSLVTFQRNTSKQKTDDDINRFI